MARLVLEFFRPRISLPLVFPLGVIAQDEQGVVYKAIPDVLLPDDVDRQFYGLDDRERFMNDDFLARVEVVAQTGEAVHVGPTDAQLLDTLRGRGTHHFLYGPVEEVQGTADEAATSVAERLKDPQARREALLQVADESMRAVLTAYSNL